MCVFVVYDAIMLIMAINIADTFNNSIVICIGNVVYTKPPTKFLSE